MSIARFKSNKVAVAAGLRPVRFKTDGTMHVLTDPATEKFSEIYSDNGTVTPPPIEPPPPPPIEPPPVVVVPPVTGGITPATFAAALASAKGGDTLRLAGGKYGALVIGIAFSAAMTIIAADPANPPVFAGINLTGAQNVTLRGIASVPSRYRRYVRSLTPISRASARPDRPSARAAVI